MEDDLLEQEVTVAVAGTVTQKKNNRPTEENLAKVLNFISSQEQPVSMKEIESGADLPMFETAMAVATLAREKAISRDNQIGGRPAFSIYVETEEQRIEAELLPKNTRGPSQKRASAKNYTKYTFQDNNYGKGKLVLALVKFYASADNKATVASVQNAFPKKLHGKFNVVDEIKGAVVKSEKQRRFFLDPNQMITLSDGTTIAVCSQWGSNNINNVVEHANGILGYEITGCED